MIAILKRYWPVVFMVAWLITAIFVGYCWGAQNVQGKWDAANAKQTADTLVATQKTLTDFAAEAKRITGVAGRIEQQTADLAKQTNTHTVEYITHVQKVPMPTNCRPDAGRLQHIDSAIADANATVAGKPDAPVPTH